MGLSDPQRLDEQVLQSTVKSQFQGKSHIGNVTYLAGLPLHGSPLQSYSSPLFHLSTSSELAEGKDVEQGRVGIEWS